MHVNELIHQKVALNYYWRTLVPPTVLYVKICSVIFCTSVTDFNTRRSMVSEIRAACKLDSSSHRQTLEDVRPRKRFY